MLFSIALHDKLASRDHDPDAVVPAISAAFLIVLALWGAFFYLPISSPETHGIDLA